MKYLVLIVLASICCCIRVNQANVLVNNDFKMLEMLEPTMLTKNLNITTFTGDTVRLPCEVANLGNHNVIWIKMNDIHPIPLTVGYQQFSRNMRYRVARIHRSDASKIDETSAGQDDRSDRVESWNFEIRKVMPEDQGLYECHVKLNSKHKIRANVYLTVLNEKDRKNKEKMEAVALYSSNYFGESPRSERLSSHSAVEKIDMPPNTWVKLRCNATGSVLTYGSQESHHHSQHNRKHGNHEGRKNHHVRHRHHHLRYDLQWYKDGKLIVQDSRRLKKWVSSYDNSNYMELDLYAVDPEDSGTYQCKRDTTILKNVVLKVVDQSNMNAGNAAAADSRRRHMNLVQSSLTFLLIGLLGVFA